MNNKDFFNLFDLREGNDYTKNYIWDETQKETGFSIIKTYPENKYFSPTKSRNGQDDDVMLIKVFTYGEPKESSLFSVGATVSKVSLFLLDNANPFQHRDDGTSPASPIEENIQKSLKSVQPINLEEMHRFSFDLEKEEFFDKKKKKVVPASFIIEHMYREHIATYSSIRGLKLKTKIKLNNWIIRTVEAVGNLLIKIIPKISGRKIENNAYNIFIKSFAWVNPKGIDDQTGTSNLMEYDNLLRKINPFTFSFVTAFILILYLFYYYFCSDFLNIISFIKANENDQIFSVTIIAFIILFFNYILPNALLFILNLLIKAYQKLSFRRFEL